MAENTPKSAEWADPDLGIIAALTKQAQKVGWKTALDELQPRFPFFAGRMRNYGLGNWHVLLGRPRSEAALDIGCGFGSLALGLSHHYRSVIGMDALASRVAFAKLRADQDSRHTAFMLGSGLDLPIRNGTFGLATLNGVLEWAGLFAVGNPRQLQQRLLSEVRRVLKRDGVLAVAIENRFAMETIAGMHDTHTGLRWVPAMPRLVADLISRAVKGQPFRTYLYGRKGYRNLAHSAGFPDVRTLDLVSSYNDYDFIVDPDDAATYTFLWAANAVKTFHQRAGRAREILAKVSPRILGHTPYAFLLLLGEAYPTLLDQSHRLWKIANTYGLECGSSRFGVNGGDPGRIAIVCHDSGRVRTVLEISPTAFTGTSAFCAVPEHVVRSLRLQPNVVSAWVQDELDLHVRAHRIYASI